ncbi:GNAT family N-acetyltransferase [Halobacillus salinus]|uniref:GNAT family N-acetyltransferase n=1 Tax=Halobacillus salinus TaxID=192814 RepID=UPI0013053BBF|nr:GNAT family N-acetyltransferase [Halobacillus salinus]
METRDIQFERDKETILQFRKDIEEVITGSKVNDYDYAAYLGRMERRIEQSNGGQVFIIRENRVIGQIGCEWREGAGYVNIFYILPEFRGQGYGREMIDWAENFFLHHGTYTYHLRVATSNERAYRLYRKSGMYPVRKEGRNYVMQKSLNFPLQDRGKGLHL